MLNVFYNVKPNRVYAKPPVVVDGPVINDTTFEWAENSCWADSIFVFFKVPGSWLENQIRNAKTVNSVITSAIDCTDKDANELYNRILQDIETIQNVGQGERKQCKTREFWTKCIEMPVKKGAFGDAFRFLTSLLKFFNVYSQVYINEDIALVIEEPSFEFVSIQIKPKYRLNHDPKMLIFSHVADTKTFPSGNVAISQNVDVNGKNFELSFVVIGRLDHFASVVRDPNSGHWWFFDHKSPLYYTDEFNQRKKVEDQYKPYRNLGFDTSWQTRKTVFPTMILDDFGRITTIQNYEYIPLIYIYTCSQTTKVKTIDLTGDPMEVSPPQSANPFAEQIAKIKKVTHTQKSDEQIINDILDENGNEDLVILKYLNEKEKYFYKYLKYKQKYKRLKKT